jgi:ElaB/YqjD/DUF883 family membrane-anchored ribosome-binding protein
MRLVGVPLQHGGGSMKDPRSELDELKTLQQEAAERRAQRKRRPRSTREPVPKAQSGKVADRNATEPTAPDPAIEEQAPEWEKNLEDLAAHLEGAATEMERAVREYPALALLAAFTIGIVVGQLFSRR